MTSIIPLSSVFRVQRKRLGLSQQQLADYAGCGLTFVNQLERGKSTLQFQKILDVLSVLGLQLHLRQGKQGVTADEALQ